MLVQGNTQDEIKQYFVDHYGARVLAEPPRAGLSWLVYIVPPVAFLVGIFLLYRAFKTWKRIPTAPETGIHTETGPHNIREDEFTSRLEEELRKRIQEK